MIVPEPKSKSRLEGTQRGLTGDRGRRLIGAGSVRSSKAVELNRCNTELSPGLNQAVKVRCKIKKVTQERYGTECRQTDHGQAGGSSTRLHQQ